MDLNQSLDPSAVTAISAAIGHLREVSATLTTTEPGVRLHEAHFAVRRAAEDKVGDYRNGLDAVLATAQQHLDARELAPGLDALLSAHAMTQAQLTSLDMLAASHGNWSLTAAPPVPTPATPPPANPPPSGLQSLFAKLGKIGAWLWSIIQTLLTPKGWSLEGDISFPGLAAAKLTVAFGA